MGNERKLFVMVNTSKLYKQLKNGKKVQLFYNESEFNLYTIWLKYENNIFTIHSYSFEGNDVYDENSYKEEQVEHFQDYQMFCDRLLEKFPGIY